MKIAIDGPAGAGKSTVAQGLAKRLGLRYLDTGAMYRAVTLQALRQGAALDDEASLVKLITSLNLEIKFDPETEENLLFIDNEDVSELIRRPEVNESVSLVASNPKVRELIVALQQQIGAQGSIIMDGRDIGTVVMPDADWKFYLEATVEERARRRKVQLEEAGHQVNLNELIEQICRRDHQDSTREVSPLKKAHDAIELDTTNFDVAESVEALLRIIRKDETNVQINCSNN